MTTVLTNEALRSSIQNASAGEVIELGGSNPFSVTTLAKFVCFSPLLPIGGYTIQSGIGEKRTLGNTRIYQANIDGPYAPANVNNVILDYSGSDNTNAIFRSSSGSFVFDAVNITGNHNGWAGNGGVYMSMTTSSGLRPIRIDLTFSNSSISIAGQSGFDGIGGNVSAFMQSWNNFGNVILENNTFDEAGYKTSFHFASLGGPIRGNYSIINNIFKRSINANVRDRGNRLESVMAVVSGNTFQDGSYLTIAGNVSLMSITAGNNFNTLYGGAGINVSQSSSAGALIGIPTISGNFFTGYGLAFTYATSNPNSILTIAGTNTITAGVLPSRTFEQFASGGFGDDAIVVNGSNDWVSGGLGNDSIITSAGDDYIIGGFGADSIFPGAGNDIILYYGTDEGGDSITGFVSGQDKLGFRAGGGGATAFTGPLNFLTTPPVAAVPTWSYVGGVLTYDADGAGAGSSPITVATFSDAPTITAADLVLF